MNIKFYPGQLEQLAIACPNLERLNLRNAQNSLQSLQGLIRVDSRIRIPVSSVESYLLLWEVLSSIKKLTHLAIDLCMLMYINNNCYNAADKDKLIGMLGNCDNLKALEIMQTLFCCYECQNVSSVKIHFPFLVYVRLFKFKCITIPNGRLKYLYYGENHSTSHLRVTHVFLQQICIKSHAMNLSAPSVRALSAHGGLEKLHCL